MRIAYYAINGIGLGHLTRTIAIARALGDGHEHLFLTSSPATELLRFHGLPYVAFPSDHHLADKSLPLKDKTYSRLLGGMVATTLNAFDPEVFVVDTLPAGVRGELSLLPTAARRTAFILRERGALDPATAAAINRYDLVLVPHAEGPAPEGIDPEKIRHTGPVLYCDRGTSFDREESRELLQTYSDNPVVGVAFGGGGDKQIAELLAWAETAAARHPELHFAISYPPLAGIDPPDDLPENVTAICYSPLAEVWRAFDFVISAAGYNSCNELLDLGVPTIFVPRERPLDDQLARARGFADAGAALIAEAFDDASLDTAIGEISDPDKRASLSARAQEAVDGNGASAAATHLLQLAGG